MNFLVAGTIGATVNGNPSGLYWWAPQNDQSKKETLK